MYPAIPSRWVTNESSLRGVPIVDRRFFHCGVPVGFSDLIPSFWSTIIYPPPPPHRFDWNRLSHSGKFGALNVPKLPPRCTWVRVTSWFNGLYTHTCNWYPPHPTHPLPPLPASLSLLWRQFCGGEWKKFDDMLASTPPGNGGRIGLFVDMPEITPQIGTTGRFRRGPEGKQASKAKQSKARQA